MRTSAFPFPNQTTASEFQQKGGVKMSQPPLPEVAGTSRPKMVLKFGSGINKLKINTSGNGNNISGAPSASATPAPGLFSSGILSTPVATPGGTVKLKIKPRTTASTPGPNPAVEDAPKPKKTKGGRTTKPSAKILESQQKRKKDDSGSEGEGSTIQVKPSKPAAKKFKLAITGKSPAAITPKTPVALKVKYKSKTVKRDPGVGYDSEASDREQDPGIEEQLILRMMPGDDCDYLREAITSKRIGIKKIDGGPDIHMKFYDPAGRRGAITIRGVSYAATVVDLPCIIEGMKSWDRRNYLKSADICQMMLVFARIEKEDDAKIIELPREVDPKTFQYPHGLTAPMRNARKRRFRKRVAQHTIEAVEEQVDALLKADQEAESTSWDLLEPEGSRRATSAFTEAEESYGEVYDEGEEDAEGEDDNGYFGTMHHGNGEALPVDEADLEADLEAELDAEMEQEAMAETPMTTSATPMAVSDFVREADSGDESVEDDYDVDDEGGEGGEREANESEKARQAQTQALREDIADLEKQIGTNEASLALQQNPILKKRLGDNIKKSKADLEGKKSELAQLLGEDDD